MSRFSNSWNLFKLSWRVLRGDKTLAAFPVISAIVSIVVAALFLGAIGLTGLGETTNAAGDKSTSLEPLAYVLGAFMYLALSIVTVYFAAALTAAADTALKGGDATVKDATGEANKHLGAIVGWAIIAAIVGWILRLIERQGIIGDIVAGLLGLAWNVLVFLAVPVIMFEDAGPIHTLKRSGSLLKETWGENLIAQVGFGLVALLFMLPGLLLVIAGVLLVSSVAPLGIVVLAMGVVALIIASVIVSAMNGIYRVALYRFAVDKVAPQAFQGTDLANAFRTRGSRGAATA